MLVVVVVVVRLGEVVGGLGLVVLVWVLFVCCLHWVLMLMFILYLKYFKMPLSMHSSSLLLGAWCWGIIQVPRPKW